MSLFKRSMNFIASHRYQIPARTALMAEEVSIQAHLQRHSFRFSLPYKAFGQFFANFAGHRPSLLLLAVLGLPTVGLVSAWGGLRELCRFAARATTQCSAHSCGQISLIRPDNRQDRLT
ncbi:MAG TPA: hypothetical protein DCK93_07225 [Blastocatellia bacterium]|nr:hypothetical protein [Blastocatellia bacterium]HAF22694.1 hypothetical protein [Blastocatellia bacterium]